MEEQDFAGEFFSKSWKVFWYLNSAPYRIAGVVREVASLAKRAYQNREKMRLDSISDLITESPASGYGYVTGGFFSALGLAGQGNLYYAAVEQTASGEPINLIYFLPLAVFNVLSVRNEMRRQRVTLEDITDYADYQS